MSQDVVAAQRTERVPIMMTKDEVAELDDWRFANRIDSRSEAIRKLVKAGVGCNSAPHATA